MDLPPRELPFIIPHIEMTSSHASGYLLISRPSLTLLLIFPPPEPRRAAVSLVLRVRPPEGLPLPTEDAAVPLENFFNQEWVRHPDARAELLFIRREKSLQQQRHEVRGAGTGGASGGASAHVAFPGGRTEEGDESALYTGKNIGRHISYAVVLANSAVILVQQLCGRRGRR